MITVDVARERILELARPLEAEAVPLELALGRTLAAPVATASAVPPFAASAMDGYAVCAAPGGTALSVVGESRAGHPAEVTLTPGSAIRISTGAAIPPGTEAVVRQEDTEVPAPGQIRLNAPAEPGANIRRAGEDMPAGAIVLVPGTRLGPPELGAAAAAGQATLPVTRRPSVRILCTGDELRPPGAALAPGEIHNSNAVMLHALAAQSGAAPGPSEIVADDPGDTERRLAGALRTADVVLISGGVSVGPHDHVKPALERLGVAEVFWRVALQPGKPTWFGHTDTALVFGLPGNPVSAAVTFTLFVRPAIRRMLGADPTPRRARGRLAAAVRQNPGRTQAIRVRLDATADGLPSAVPTGDQGSHRTSSLLGADALAFIDPGDGELAAGSPVRLELLEP